MKKPDKERSDNEVPTTDIRKPFFFIGRYYFFTISFFFIILVVMVVREGKVPQYQGVIVIRYYLALRGAENGVTVMVTPFFCV